MGMAAGIASRTGMQMGWDFIDDKDVLFFAKGLPARVDGTAIGGSRTDKAAAHGKGHPSRAIPNFRGIRAIDGKVNGTDWEWALLYFLDGFFRHIVIGNFSPAAVAVKDGIRLASSRSWDDATLASCLIATACEVRECDILRSIKRYPMYFPCRLKFGGTSSIAGYTICMRLGICQVGIEIGCRRCNPFIQPSIVTDKL